MGRIEDVSDTERKLKVALARLKESSILDENKQLISNFYFSLRRENLKRNTQINHLRILRWICEIYEEMSIKKPLHEITLHDFDSLLFCLEEDKHYKPGTINMFKKSFKKFMKWYYEDDKLPRWVNKEIKLVRCDSPVQPQDIPTMEDIDEFIEVARNPRDKALIAVAVDGGMRIGALLSCTVGSVVESKHGVILYLSKEGTNKTTPAKGIPLTYSSGYLQNWLANHPFRQEPNFKDMPLWTTLKHKTGNIEALSYDGLYQMFLKCEARLKKCKKHIHPHTTRHFAVTSWILDGLNTQAINHRAGWVKDSLQMQRVYGNFSDLDINKQIWEHYGLITEEDEKRQVTLKKCPRCNNILKPGDRFCSQCNLPLSMDSLNEMQEREKEIQAVLALYQLMATKGIGVEEIQEQVKRQAKEERK